MNGFVMDSIIDYVIHAWVIISLISGLVSFSKLKRLPEEDETMLSAEAPVLEASDITNVAHSENSVVEASEETI